MEFVRSLRRLALEGLEAELGLFLSELKWMLDKSDLECLLWVEEVALVLELLQAETVIHRSNIVSMQVVVMVSRQEWG